MKAGAVIIISLLTGALCFGLGWYYGMSQCADPAPLHDGYSKIIREKDSIALKAIHYADSLHKIKYDTVYITKYRAVYLVDRIQPDSILSLWARFNEQFEDSAYQVRFLQSPYSLWVQRGQDSIPE